mgnify:FL=1|tara:strand:+ start:129 stop:737 length:609 start_codon:yes stop_codon:yes gene_type:complete
MKKLIIAPHVDDDVLGCGGIIDEETVVLYCGLDETGIKNRPSFNVRIQEANAVQNFLKHKYILLENKVNNYKVQDLIGQIEKVINEEKPDEVFIPHPSYNQDHKVVYDASLIALRPHDLNHFVKLVAVYEQPHSFLWVGSNDYTPNYFVEIDIDSKVEAYMLMETQVRKFRSPETITSLAQLRGAQSNFKFAESFQLLRFVR